MKTKTAKEIEDCFWTKVSEEIGISLDHPKFDLLKELSLVYAELLFPEYSTDNVHIFAIFQQLTELVK